MLKIKDNVDLKELEKFGFKKIEKETNWRLEHMGDYDKHRNIIVYSKNREIDFNCFLDELDIDEYSETLYDLIKADIVEKVD